MLNNHLLVINYAMDAKSQVFAHQIEVVNALASKFENITVLTGRKGIHESRNNVKVIEYKWQVGKKLTNIVQFSIQFIKVMVKFRPKIIFSHMTSVQSAIISPISKIFGIQHYLWYAHTSNNLYLKFCNLFVNKIITSTPGSCPISKNKVIAIGQSIDSNKFTPKSTQNFPIKKLVHIGRFDPSKNISEIILSVARARNAGQNLTLDIIGSPSTEEFEDQAKQLFIKFQDYIDQGWLVFTESIPREAIPQLLLNFDAFIHMFQGSLDKTIVEATFSKLPVVTINNEYLNIFGSWSYLENSERNLDSELKNLLVINPEKIKIELTRRLEIAQKYHEISGWTGRLSNILLDNN